MVDVTDRVAVVFEGDGCDVEEMSWGQREIWASMVRCGHAKPIGGTVPLPATTTVDDVAAELRYLMSRYQVMRTRLRFDGGEWPRQTVSAGGTVVLEIVDVTGADPAQAAAELCQSYRDTAFDYAEDWPVRMGVVRGDGVLTHLVAIMCHLALNGFGGAVMLREIGARTAEPVAGAQPVEQARWQRSAAGQRQNAMAMRYWDGLLRTMPPPWWGHSTDPRQPRHWHGIYDSPALLLSARSIAQRTGEETASVLLAAYAVALARVTGINPVAVRAMSSNRFRSSLADVVAPVCQASLCVIDVAGVDFDETVRRARQAAMVAYKHAYFDPAALQKLLDEMVARRGPEFDLDCYFNDRRVAHRQDPPGVAVTAADIKDAVSRGALRWIGSADHPSSRLYVQVDDVPETIQLNIFADTQHLSPADAEELLRQVETVAVDAALGGLDASG